MYLIYTYEGHELPEYIFDSIYQTLLINTIKIYILLSDDLIEKCYEKLDKININKELIQIIPLSVLNSKEIEEYKCIITEKFKDISNFRNGFWIHTTLRFFYIKRFIEIFYKNVSNVSFFHIECDVMLYECLFNIKENICKKNSLYVVKDNPKRVIPSIIYIPDLKSMIDLINYIIEKVKVSNIFLNDMDLLGSYDNICPFPYTFINNQSEYIFDGACIGQYLGGIDVKNIEKGELEDINYIRFNNPTCKFINETSDFKINDNMTFFRKTSFIKTNSKPLQLMYCINKKQDEDELKKIANLHIHSKQLYLFSSIFNIKFNDIITGDRILSLCDYIICTQDIYNYHKELQTNTTIQDKIIIIRNFKNVNINKFNDYIKQLNKNIVNIFVYTHILNECIENILYKCSINFKYNIYLHNSDNAFGNHDLHKELLKLKHINKIYSQNIDYIKQDKKLHLLPIGIANNMFSHGNLIDLYKTMSETYIYKKTENIYININPNTFPYRKTFLDKYNRNSTNKPYKEYLQELSKYRFCLAIRGNGIDTHRFWESLYLGVIPVIINNTDTKMNNFICYLKNLQIPFYEITEDDLDIIIQKFFLNDFFNETLYDKITRNYIHLCDALKLNNYI